jgi:hypothetical protein
MLPAATFADLTNCLKMYKRGIKKEINEIREINK